MKIALATTTINRPVALSAYRKFGPEVRFFVAGDIKTDSGAQDFCAALGNCDYLSPEKQRGFDYKCSELISWNTVRRRNVAVLEALRWGADVIVVWDDDNLAINPLYFANILKYFWFPNTLSVSNFHGIKASSPTKWFDPGQLMIPQIPHRGFPYDKKAQPVFEAVTDAKVGVAAGLCLGDPDIDATTRIVTAPTVHGVSELARSGIVVDPKETWTVFNTQNTAFIRELAPAMFCAPGLGRMDDIIASLITQRVMRERDLHVHIGQPFVWQQRNQHNLMDDLKEEVWGMGALTNIADILNEIRLPPGASCVDACRSLWQHLAVGWVPGAAHHAAMAFLDDCEAVL